ncbi:MAG: glycosyltransferase, partial [Gemmatimonadaceae bacterium]
FGAARARSGTGSRSLRAWALGLPLAAGEFDIVHFEYSGIAVSYLDVLSLLAPAKLIVSCRGAAEQITPLVDAKRAEGLRAMFAVVDRVHCVSNDMVDTVRQYGLDPRRAFVNYPSIDLGEFRRLRPYRAATEGPVRIVSTGRLHWKKGFEYALLAVRKLLDAGHDVSYAILGGGPEEERLRVTISDLRLAGCVELRGRQPSGAVRSALEEADIYLLPSVSEGLSNAALEAMAMELPVVSTSAGGMAEAIDDGLEGLLVPTRDADALARRIEDLLRDPGRRAEMGRAGRRRVERQFSLEGQTARFVEEYERCRR